MPDKASYRAGTMQFMAIKVFPGERIDVKWYTLLLLENRPDVLGTYQSPT